ncbi:hypothetical protein BaRGS_00016156 [Batillaria attramentaria]|uniref:Uncharacterized protein n=1 Tax=Batillaria attramentaria TaxID=370345 RepID=A0ABD0KZQ4_9CAEN
MFAIYKEGGGRKGRVVGESWPGRGARRRKLGAQGRKIRRGSAVTHGSVLRHEEDENQRPVTQRLCYAPNNSSIPIVHVTDRTPRQLNRSPGGAGNLGPSGL